MQAEIDSLKAQLAAGGGAVVAGAKEDMSTKPTLGYWTIRGLGAQIRYMFAYCNVEFEDKQYVFKGTQDNVDRSDWLDVKQTLGLEYPNLPYLIDGNTKITETKAIMKYVAKKYQPALLGASAAEVGRIEMLSAHCDQLKGKSTGPCYATGDRDAIIDECRPLLASIMNAKGNNKWIAGNNLSWLDF